MGVKPGMVLISDRYSSVVARQQEVDPREAAGADGQERLARDAAGCVRAHLGVEVRRTSMVRDAPERYLAM